MTTATSTRQLEQQRRLRRGQRSGPHARQSHPAAPVGRAGGVSAPSLLLQPLGRACSLPEPQSTRPAPRVQSRVRASAQVEGGLTERGLKLVIGTFGALMAIAVVVIVAQFFAVSNAPVTPSVAAAAHP